MYPNPHIRILEVVDTDLIQVITNYEKDVNYYDKHNLVVYAIENNIVILNSGIQILNTTAQEILTPNEESIVDLVKIVEGYIDNLLPVLGETGNPLSVALANTGQLDAFDALRVSSNGNRFDNEFIYGLDEESIDNVLLGRGSTATWNTNSRDVTLAIVDAINGSGRALYSHYDIPYTAGNSQRIIGTGVLNLANIAGGTAYFFLRTKVTGAVVDYPTDITILTTDIDWSFAHIFDMDFQSLKVGRIRFRLNKDGLPYDLGSILNDNVRNTGYWQNPTLPAMWRIYNDATYTYTEIGYGDGDNAIGIRYRVPKNALATMKAICVTVKSESGEEIFNMPGKNRSQDSGLTAKVVTTTRNVMMSIRPRATFKGVTNRMLYIPLSYSYTGDNPTRVRILYKPTLTGAVWLPCGDPITAGSFDVGEWYVILSIGSTDFTLIGASANTVGLSFIATGVGAGTGTAVDEHSGMEYDISASAITGGSLIDSTHFATAKNNPNGLDGILGKTIMSLNRTAIPDILSGTAIRSSLATANSSSYFSFNWKEIGR